ncbi:MAG: SusC/RagA family TonB-linked outer membrane protein [Pedobacter sp.]|nr:MAG: SusC/RagA family TonB-linked outer membrane protein [Pedobacter sp.]
MTSTEDGQPIPGASVKIKGTTTAEQTLPTGLYSIKANQGDVLQFTYLGMVAQERTVGSSTVINIAFVADPKSLNEVVVTALGQKVSKRTLGTSQQEVKGADIAGTQRENFVNALQGRVAGIDVTSTSGVPGASSSITIRGVSSISGSNQPLMIIDGLPIDNKSLSTAAFFSDVSSNTSQANRTTDFTNRSSDINPEDIESLVVLKGPEAAALYGIDAANGAIVITTKRGKPGQGAIDYSNSFRIDAPRGKPEVQKVYGISGSTIGVGTGNGSFLYFGDEYPAGTTFYDNIDGFFQNALTQKHNLSLSGGSDRVNYRVSTAYTNQNGIIPNSLYDRINITGATQATLNDWLKTDLSIGYTYSNNDQARKGVGGPLIGLLVWPQTDEAKNYLTPAGTRRQISTLATSQEMDNPYFNVNKNKINSKVNRILTNLGFTITPFKFMNIKSNIGIDNYTSQNLVLRHPESASGFSFKGILDIANDVTRNINMQNLINLNKQTLFEGLSIDATLGQSFQDLRSNIDAMYGEGFLDPNFVSINNTSIRQARSTLTQRRLVSFFGRATLNYKDYLYVTGTLRNDRTSTIPVDRYSFWYPSISGSFVFTDVPAFKGLQKIFTSGRLRAAYAEVGKDARPYAYRPSLESKLTVGGGYGYGFTGPNLDLRPEFAKSYEFGAELAFLNDRLGVDFTYYNKQTVDQIVNDIRGSYSTGFILFNLNGGETRNRGVEITLRGTPVKKKDFSWNILANFEKAKGTVLALPNSLPESYVSDTWLYGNVRNGNTPGRSTRSLTGFFYLKNNQGSLLIDPTTGLPLRSTVFIDGGYDRQPDFSIGITNTFTYKDFNLSFLFDIRKGGDILNATEHYLTTRGLTNRTLDRDNPRVITGVIRDGLENTANPTANNIVVVPRYQTGYYTGISEELFIEKDINWLRLRDVTVSYRLPATLLKKQKFVKSASVFLTGTDLFVLTNYSGLDPIVNGNSAAVGGSGGAGIDYGSFPIPMGVNFGVRIGL